MYNIKLIGRDHKHLTDSFYYDQKLIPGIEVMHNNSMYLVTDSLEVSTIYSTELIKDKFLKVLNKTYTGCTHDEMEYIIQMLDQELFIQSEELNRTQK